MNARSEEEDKQVAGARGKPGPKPKATLETVREAIKRLKAQGQALGAIEIRSLTGGSYATIYKVLAELGESGLPIRSSVPLPDAVAKGMKAWVDSAVVDVTAQWQERLNQEQRLCAQFQAAATQLEAENDALRESIERLQRAGDESAVRSTILREELDRRQDEITQLRNLVHAAELRAFRAEDECTAAIERLASQDLLLSKTTIQLDQHRDVLADMREELGVTKTHLQHACIQIEELQQARGLRPTVKAVTHSSQHGVEGTRVTPPKSNDPAAFEHGYDDEDSPLG